MADLQRDLALHIAGDSLFREEFEGAAARRDLAHGMAAALTEPSCCWRLIVDVHRWVVPLRRRGTGGRAEQATKAGNGEKPKNKE